MSCDYVNTRYYKKRTFLTFQFSIIFTKIYTFLITTASRLTDCRRRRTAEKGRGWPSGPRRRFAKDRTIRVGRRSFIFLDEIGDSPFHLKSKLLRMIKGGRFKHVGGLETIEVDIRIICGHKTRFGKNLRGAQLPIGPLLSIECISD